mmetsp:Transcript_80326/g.215312  ORF Transcript_80326/g.215312 Transcript_80326/m.215312 type:complete len:358 (-) Transcript_80326:63-1136(-)
MNCAIPRIRAVALILLVSFNQIVGRKTDISIVNDVRSAFLVEPFCFDDDGFVDIRLQNFVQYEGTNQLASPKNVGFIVRKTNNPQAAYNPAVVTEFLDGCILSREYMLPGDVKIMIDKPDLNASFHTDSLGSGLYTVIYANCAEGTMVSYDLHMTLTNRGGQMLPAGSIPLPICFGIFFFAFLIALVVWVVVMLRNRESTHRIHVLMAVLCAVKVRGTAKPPTPPHAQIHSRRRWRRERTAMHDPSGPFQQPSICSHWAHFHLREESLPSKEKYEGKRNSLSDAESGAAYACLLSSSLLSLSPPFHHFPPYRRASPPFPYAEKGPLTPKESCLFSPTADPLPFISCQSLSLSLSPST